MPPRLTPALLLLAACASAPPVARSSAPGSVRPTAGPAGLPALPGLPTVRPLPGLPALPALAPPPPRPLLPPTEEERLDEAARLLADGLGLPRVAELLAAVAPGPRRLDLLQGQLCELLGDDPGAVSAYGRALAKADDDEVRLRRALALERLGRGGEAEDDLRRLRPESPRQPEQEARPARQLRPLRPSSR